MDGVTVNVGVVVDSVTLGATIGTLEVTVGVAVNISGVGVSVTNVILPPGHTARAPMTQVRIVNRTPVSAIYCS